jgi:hypothetical protein
MVPNRFGPREAAEGDRAFGHELLHGNPDGAHVDAIEICHEPNLRWPGEPARHAVPEMIRSAAAIATRYGGPAILAPSVADIGEDDLALEGAEGTPGRLFTERVLRDLAGWSPEGIYVGWSQHNWSDMAGRTTEGVRWTQELLHARNWRGGGDRWVWLTQGGYALPDPQAVTNEDALEDERIQYELLRENFAAMSELPGVPIWTQHTIHDLPGEHGKPGLCRDFDLQRGEPGVEKFAYQLWRDLPGAPGPAQLEPLGRRRGRVEDALAALARGRPRR